MTVAAIAALFNPLPAAAAPPPSTPAPAVPDAGSRPLAQGPLVLPGQQAGTTPATTAPVSTPGVAMTPLMAKVERGRTELASLGEQLTKTQEDVDLTALQVTDATQRVAQYSAAVTQAQAEVADAAATAVRDAAAMPPGSFGSGLSDLDSLARLNRGDYATQQAASRQLAIAQDAYAAALAEQQAAQSRLTKFTADRDKLQQAVDKKSAAQQKLEQKNAAEIAAWEASQAAQDAQAGAGYLGGENAGRGADPRAIAALRYALAQRGDWYKWSEEGPDLFDCSGLMWAAYRAPGAGDFPLTRVSRDQYNQTRKRAVDRYSLLPGDLLFFSSSSSWRQIHHVAMYAGDGMMVEAPRARLKVRLVPVRWTRLFGATRIFGSIEGPVEGPELGAPDEETPRDHSTPKPPKTTSATPSASASPSTTASSSKSPSPSTTASSSKSPSPSTTASSSKSPSPSTSAAPITTSTAPVSPGGTAEDQPPKSGSRSPAGSAAKPVSPSAAAAAAAKSAGS